MPSTKRSTVDARSSRTGARRTTRARLLLVEPDETRRASLRHAIQRAADIDVLPDFLTARRHLLARRYDWLVTNVRLASYNGLHLVHLAATKRRPVRAVVFAGGADLWLAREAQRIGAFYESRDRLEIIMPAILRGAMPPADRRNPSVPERRGVMRGGRRCTDLTDAAKIA